SAQEWSVRVNGFQQAYSFSKSVGIEFADPADRPKTEAGCGQVVVKATFFVHNAKSDTWTVGKPMAEYKSVWDKGQNLCQVGGSFSVASNAEIDAVVASKASIAVGGAPKKVQVRGYIR